MKKLDNLSGKSLKICVALLGVALMTGACNRGWKYAPQNAVKDGEATPDMAYNDVKGPVHTIKTGNDFGYGTYYNDNDLVFDIDGTWINIPIWNGEEKKEFANYNGEKYQKDANGYIIMTHEADYGEGESYPITSSIVWENGKIKQRSDKSSSNSTDYYYSSSTDTDYEYDDKGLLIKESSKRKDSSSWGSNTYSSTKTYSYVDFDEHGNWTKRIVNSKDVYDKGEPYTDTRTEERIITYYE